MTELDRSADAGPLHVQLADILRQRIVQGVWSAGDAIPGEKALCAEFSVARGTVRQALRWLEEEGYLRREQGRGSFVESKVRTQFGTGRQSTRVAFIVPYVRDSSVLSIFVGFQDAAARLGWTVIFRQANSGIDEQRETIEKLVADGITAIALYPADCDSGEPLADAIPPGLPLVLIDRYLKGLEADYVASDHFGGALWAVQHLIDHGHRRVGFVRWLSTSTSIEHRMLGYQQALRERQIEVDPSLTFQVENYPTVDVTSLVAYLSRPDRPTAVMAANDQIAIALYRAAAVSGLRVPDDLSIIGFDNLDLSARLEPGLTTMAQQFNEIGQAAVRLLADRMTNNGPYQHLTLAPQLVVRSSVRTLAAKPALETV